MSRPAVVVFDVNETLSDLAALAARFAEVGANPSLLPVWFAGTLRDGFALTVTGRAAAFRDLAAAVLRGLLAGAGVPHPDAATERILDGFSGLPVHPDVVDGVRALRAGGHRLVTLSNGAATVGEALLSSAGVRADFEAVLSVEDAGRWKPDPIAYRFAAERCGTAIEDMLLVAVHPWDIHGAACAGMRTAWLRRGGGDYPAPFAPPEITIAALPELAAVLS